MCQCRIATKTKGEMDKKMTINKMVVFVLLVLTFSVMCVVLVCGLSESPDISAAQGVNNTSTNETVYGSGPTSPATAETGLVAYYPLDGDIVDHSVVLMAQFMVLLLSWGTEDGHCVLTGWTNTFWHLSI
jgi:hypothetical protein